MCTCSNHVSDVFGGLAKFQSFIYYSCNYLQVSEKVASIMIQSVWTDLYVSSFFFIYSLNNYVRLMLCRGS